MSTTERAVSHVTGLDHAGFIVRDLSSSCNLLERLGFRITVRADHTRTNDQGKTVPAGSSQRSVMFHRGYIEIMQITDPTAGHQLTPATRVRHGLHVIALGTRDAAACHAACIRRGVKVGALLDWSRPIREGRVSGLARFCYFDSRWDPHDPSYICWVQHMTPELIRPHGLMEHANGAQALVGVQYRGPKRLAQSWARQLIGAGASAHRKRAGGFTVNFHDARFDIEVDETLPSVLPGALVLAGQDLAGMRRRCAAMGVATQDGPNGELALDLRAELGVHWVLLPVAA